MNKKALENLVNIHKLHHEAADASEVNGLIRVCEEVKLAVNELKSTDG